MNRIISRTATIAALTGALVAISTTAALADPPASTPTNLTATGTSGVVQLSAISTAQLVQFYVDGTVIGVPATVQAGDGSVSFGWESWGYPNGPHTITAADCS
ncbi:MAG TPA: hypothetical protein VKB75_11415, partial [Jatrophihabitans sp.]|nr:hypothetical protein [Jatrophihabitans sp.]